MLEATIATGRLRRWLFGCVVVVASVFVGVGLAEIALRTIVRSYSPITFDLYSRDPDGQLRLRPRARRQHTTPEWDVLVETNARGFRGGDWPGAGGRALIALGDSFAFGWGVEQNDTFLSKVERALVSAGSDAGLTNATVGIRVLNAAVPGSGTTDQLALLRVLLRDIHPAVVLVCFYAGNDFQDVADGGASQFDVVDGLLERRALTSGWVDRVRGWIKRKSYVAQMIARLAWIREQHRTADVPVARRAHPGLDRRDVALRQFMQMHLREAPPAPLKKGITETLTALTEIRQLALSQGARFVLLVVPRNIQVHEEDRRRYEAAFDIAPGDWDLDRPQEILSSWATVQGAEYVDPLPAMRQAAAAGPARLYYFPDSHMTATGHAVIADELARHFADHPIASSSERTQ